MSSCLFFFSVSCLTATTLTLTAIVCEQLKTVTFPKQGRITQHRKVVVIIFIWTMSVLVSISILLVKKYENYQGRNFPDVSCDDDWESLSTTYPLKQLYYTFTSIILFFLPVTIMIVLYFIIVCRLHGFQVPGETKRNIYQQAKKKVIKMACIVIVTLLLCYSPMQVATLYSKVWLSGTQQGEFPSWFHHFQYTSMLLGHFNCAVNPFLYAAFRKDFRESLWSILKCKATRQPRRSNFPIFSPRESSATVENDLTKLTGSKKVIRNFISQEKTTYVPFGTASIYVKDNYGEYRQCRAVLDSASEASFITNDCTTFTGLKRNKINLPVGGLNGALVTVNQQIKTEYLLTKIVIL
ncbi:g_PROTEIN_RECEP_F1_2 domain-containing protein [Nephila pilipes]|uniref:G_PROTEIN_RECEP_F1_2 domain-containing protein n=1 Tax=Nephila pilipes TaxID=299642 RepID=A0A8X6MS49_NEPPI|nr:g_PROTEIN_RECEP_F1_2 domain-containing protein [Nephila pilipes]